MAVGSLCGGMGAGMLAGKMKPSKGYLLLFCYDVSCNLVFDTDYVVFTDDCTGQSGWKGNILFFIVTIIVVLLSFAMKKPFARFAELVEK